MRKIEIFIASLVAGSALVMIKPAAAATFNFTFSGGNGGDLSFDGTVPTGTVQLSQLNNVSFSYFFNGEPTPPGRSVLLIGPDSVANTTLTFANGALTGITSESTLNNYSSFVTGGSSSIGVIGDYALFLQGNTFVQYFTGKLIASIYDFSTGQSNTYVSTYNNQEFASGYISFQNSQSVPEPSTVLGTIAALGIATRFRRKLTNS